MKHLGREISTTELRLLPYIHYVMVNDQQIEHRRVGPEGQAVLAQWSEAGLAQQVPGKFQVSRALWDFMNDAIWLGYVVYNDDAEIKQHA